MVYGELKLKDILKNLGFELLEFERSESSLSIDIKKVDEQIDGVNATISDLQKVGIAEFTTNMLLLGKKKDIGSLNLTAWGTC